MKLTYGPGILLCMAIAVPAWLLGKIIPIVGGPVIGILLGMILSLIRPVGDNTSKGIKFTSKKILQYSIVLLGFDMNLYNIFKVGQQSLLIIISTITAALITAFVITKCLTLPSKTGILIGVGSAICGGSAIAATAPVIGAKDEEVAQSISTVFIFNVIAAFIFPSLGLLMGMTDEGFGMWAGTAVNDTSSVVAAATVWSNAAGNDTALALATIVKLTRTLAIIPITFILAVYFSRKAKDNEATAQFSLLKIFPWFVLFFLLAAVISTVTGMPETVSKPVVKIGKFMITMAMAAIGLNTNIRQLIKHGAKPIFLGLCCWIAVAVTSIGVQIALNIW